jgi:hypothetical protein
MARSQKQEILSRATTYYLESGDFNGLPVRDILDDKRANEAQVFRAINALVRDGTGCLLFGDRHPNVHIRAFAEEAADVQIAKLRRWRGSEKDATPYDVMEIGGHQIAFIEDNLCPCLYPTAAYLERVVDRTQYAGRPFTLRLAMGEPSLNFETFDLSVLEAYRNDPRFYYHNNEVSGSIYFTSEDESVPDADRVLLDHFGIAFDPDFNRAIAVLLTDLKNLSPEHQQVWNSKKVAGDYRLHPDFGSATYLGEWPEGISLFDAFTSLIGFINEESALMGKPPLFLNELSDEKKPREFGFLIRPTAKEFNDFVLLLDKSLSDNINKKFFQREVVYEREETRKDGKVAVTQKGTIALLEEWLRSRYRAADWKPIEEMLATFREVRKRRQEPAHALNQNAFDQKYLREQRDLITRAVDALDTLSRVLGDHPSVRAASPKHPLESVSVWAH